MTGMKKTIFFVGCRVEISAMHGSHETLKDALKRALETSLKNRTKKRTEAPRNNVCGGHRTTTFTQDFRYMNAIPLDHMELSTASWRICLGGGKGAVKGTSGAKKGGFEACRFFGWKIVVSVFIWGNFPLNHDYGRRGYPDPYFEDFWRIKMHWLVIRLSKKKHLDRNMGLPPRTSNKGGKKAHEER